jgi:hypothetical protein
MAVVLPLEKTWNDARGLAARYQDGPGFRHYVASRMVFVAPAAVLFLLTSIACAAATVIFLADRHPLLALPALLLAPFVLVGSLFVQAFVFFSWVEGRALAHALGRRKKAPLDFGEMPAVPWAFAGVFLVLPLLMLGAVSGTAVLVLILLVVAIALAFARFDR